MAVDMDALRDLRDRLDVAEVIARYAAGIDERDFADYRRCFTADVEFLGFGAEPIHGVEAWVDFVEKTLEPFRATQHMLGPSQVTLRGDEAELRAELRAEHFYREPPGRIFTVWGTYHSRLVRADAGWRIGRHRLDVRARRTLEAPR